MHARKAIATALLLWAGGVVAAPSQGDLDARVTRLEQLMESQTLVDMLQRIEGLQQEVQQLRGQVEEQQHTIQALQRRQRELYVDMDRRLSRLEQGNASGATNSGNTVAGDSDDAAEQGAYQRAFDLLRDSRYDEAAAGFRQFLERFPNGHYAHVAQYWIGEASYARRDFQAAITEYQRLIELYANSPKVPEALLKIGTCRHELEENDAATQVLTDLVTRFPDSTEAGQARTLLQQIKNPQ